MESLSRAILRQSLELSHEVVTGLLSDMSQADWLARPHADCNPINWQVGHLILSEHMQMHQISPGCMPPMPQRMEQLYAKPPEPTKLPCCESVGGLLPRVTLLSAMKEQRRETLTQLGVLSEQQLSQPTGIPYAPYVHSVFTMIALHWSLHSGQWVIVRRMAGLPVKM